MRIRIEDPKNVHMDPDPGGISWCGSGSETLDISIGLDLEMLRLVILPDIWHRLDTGNPVGFIWYFGFPGIRYLAWFSGRILDIKRLD